MRLQGKIAIVTGAGQSEGQGIGNGRATAIAFAREGATVVLADRDEESARETAETIGEPASVVKADVAVEDDCARIVAACVELHGRVDVLHHNVGTGTGDGWAENLDIEAWGAHRARELLCATTAGRRRDPRERADAGADRHPDGRRGGGAPVRHRSRPLRRGAQRSGAAQGRDGERLGRATGALQPVDGGQSCRIG